MPSIGHVIFVIHDPRESRLGVRRAGRAGGVDRALGQSFDPSGIEPLRLGGHASAGRGIDPSKALYRAQRANHALELACLPQTDGGDRRLSLTHKPRASAPEAGCTARGVPNW